MTLKIDSQELEARQMIHDFREAQEWHQERQLMLMVWKAMWSSALGIERINQVANALGGVEHADLQRVCTHAVRAGLLRSYMVGRERMYELKLS